MDNKPDRRTLVATAICVAVIGAMCLSTMFGVFAIRSTEPADVARELFSTLLIFSVIIGLGTLTMLFLVDHYKVIRLSGVIRGIARWAYTVSALVLVVSALLMAVEIVLKSVGKWPPGLRPDQKVSVEDKHERHSRPRGSKS